MAALRYNLGNSVVLERRNHRQQAGARIMPVVRERAALDSGALAMVASAGSSTSGIQSEQWRRSYGMMGPSAPGVQGWRNP
jgi:hypothetical protein